MSRALALNGLDVPKPEKPKRKRKKKPKPKMVDVSQWLTVGGLMTTSTITENPQWVYTGAMTTSTAAGPGYYHAQTVPLLQMPHGDRQDLPARVRRKRNEYVAAHNRAPRSVYLGIAEQQELTALLKAQFGGKVPPLPPKIDGLMVKFHGADSILEVSEMAF